MADEEKDKASEPAAEYSAAKQITFFNSHHEMEEAKISKMASMNHFELLSNLEIMRKFMLREYLTAEGKWPKLSLSITIKPANT